MNAPFDPEETQDGAEHEDPFGENSMTWGAADPAFDELFRDRLGPLPTMPTPPYAFERVLLAGRRRRARKVWGMSAAAVLVVMAGTAGTTVALHGSSPGLAGPAAGSSQQSTTLLSSPTPSFSVAPSPSASATPSATATTSSATATSSASTTTTAQCHSDDLQLTVTVQSGSDGSADSLLIVLRNNSAHSCTTYGYPGLQTETVNEQLQTTTVKRVTPGGSPKHLTVGPGQYISTIATFTTAASTATPSPSAGCGAPSYYLAVIPPNEQNQIAATIQGGPVTVCDSGVLDTSPLVMGETGQ